MRASMLKIVIASLLSLSSLAIAANDAGSLPPSQDVVLINADGGSQPVALMDGPKRPCC